MFSAAEKKLIAGVLEATILGLDHPEMPNDRPVFRLHVEGNEGWSWADIEPNWILEENEK